MLTKCIAGIYEPDEGEIFWEGRPVHIRTPKDAASLGIETVYQDLALADNLDIVQNMFLGRERLSRGLLDEDSMERAAAETLCQPARHDRALHPPAGGDAVGRPAPGGRRGQGGHVELEAGHARRADRRARRGPDRAGPRPRSGASRTTAWR